MCEGLALQQTSLTMLFITLKSCASLYLDLSASITRNMGVLHALRVSTYTPACIRREIVLLTPLVSFTPLFLKFYAIGNVIKHHAVVV